MKKVIIFILIFISIIFVSFYFLDYNYFANLLIQDQSINKYYLLFFIFVSFLYFLTPLPVTLIIIANGYFFQNLGFILSLIHI